ncbi:MAG: epoxyqueuosine reductase QueH [Desulfovibrionaceae bacterium]
MPRVLVHICCGPCAISTVRSLLAEGFEVTGFFYNPNIHPLQEYLRRREAAAQAAERLGIPVIWKDNEYDPQAWFRAVSHREANRCFHCYALRLERTRQIAARGNFDAFTSTLLYSRRQKHDVIAQVGRDMAGGGAPAFLYRDFRTGWQQGIDTSKEWGLYRQQYCGCLYSENERYERELRAVCAACDEKK